MSPSSAFETYTNVAAAASPAPTSDAIAATEIPLITVPNAFMVSSLCCLYASTFEILSFDPVSRPENPRHDRQRYRHEGDGHDETDADAHVRDTVKAPAEAADQVDDRVEQADRLPKWRHPLHPIKTAPTHPPCSDHTQ